MSVKHFCCVNCHFFIEKDTVVYRLRSTKTHNRFSVGYRIHGELIWTSRESFWSLPNIPLQWTILDTLPIRPLMFLQSFHRYPSTAIDNDGRRYALEPSYSAWVWEEETKTWYAFGDSAQAISSELYWWGSYCSQWKLFHPQKTVWHLSSPSVAR